MRFQIIFAPLLLCSFATSLLQAAPHHHFGWKSNPHHAKGLTQIVHSPKFSTAPTPDIVDLSGVMPDSGTVAAPLAVHFPAIYDQGREGSCVPNTGTADMEFIWHKTFNAFIGGSRQGLYACCLTHDGHWPNDVGSYTSSVVWALQNNGLGLESLCPYSTPLSQTMSFPYLGDAATRKAVHAYDVDSTDHVSIQVALANGLPVMGGGFVYLSIEGQTMQNHFNLPSAGQGRPLGGHERLIVGYNRKLSHTYPKQGLFGKAKTVTGFYWVRNSWGPDWGYKGYCWEPMSEIENPSINEDFAVVDVVAAPAPPKVSMMKTDADGFLIPPHLRDLGVAASQLAALTR